MFVKRTMGSGPSSAGGSEIPAGRVYIDTNRYARTLTRERAHSIARSCARVRMYLTRDSISLRIVAAVNVYGRAVGLNARKLGPSCVYVKYTRAYTQAHTRVEIGGNLRREERTCVIVSHLRP